MLALILAGALGANLAEVSPVTAGIMASGETVPVETAADDAADDPAVWRNPRDPARSLIVATDKKAGIHVYALDGAARDFRPDGRLNNVDLIDLGRRGAIVLASDRSDPAQARLQVYRLDPRAARLEPLGSVEGGKGEAYGLCLTGSDRALDAFSVLKDGTVHQVRIRFAQGKPQGAIVRTLKLEGQAEGCVVDPRSRRLYVGEEARGVWAFDARATAPTAGTLIAPADGRHLVPDVEGLALAPSGKRGGLLVVSSQGDNAFALFRLPGMQPAGRFRIVAGAVSAVEETDGIALHQGDFGRRYPAGLFIAQDGRNAPHAQNFKMVSWRAVLRALAQTEQR